MLRVLMYATHICPYCHMAEKLLARKGVSADKIMVDDVPERRELANGPSMARSPRLDARMESRAMQQGCCDYGFDPIGEGTGTPSMARAPRLDPIGEAANATSLSRGPRLDPIGEAANATSLSRGPRLDPIGETHVGGYTDLAALDRKGDLDQLLART
jgi:glutaredoxin